MVEKFIIGHVGAPFGIKGFVKIRSLSGELDHLLKLKSVIISKDGNEQVYQIEESSPAPPVVLMRFSGINTPEAVKTLTGGQLIAGREQASTLNEGEYYIEDLKGFPVVFGQQPVGHIKDIIEGGGGNLVEIRLCNGDIKLVPFMDEFFYEIIPGKDILILKNLWILE
jgi:16S rRNA processing protein RimM